MKHYTSKWDKHSKPRSGEKKPPGYVPNRGYVKPKPSKRNSPAPPKEHKNKYKKENQDGSA